MSNIIRHVLCRGIVNKDMRVMYAYKFEDGKDGKWSTVRVPDNGNGYTILQAFSLSITEGFDKPHIFIPASQYFLFVVLLHKTIPMVQKHIHELYPKLGEEEFEMDSRVLERFMIEKAMRAGSIGIIPGKWVDGTGKCYPSLRLENEYGKINIPLEDCIIIDEMLRTFDPNTFGLIALNMLYGGGN